MWGAGDRTMDSHVTCAWPGEGTQGTLVMQYLFGDTRVTRAPRYCVHLAAEENGASAFFGAAELKPESSSVQLLHLRN
ncbi:unnamed protein product, partial [Iphiclides podalirius]